MNVVQQVGFMCLYSLSNVAHVHVSFSQHNVKVFVDWKYKTNGDPMVDVAYLCMMFLRPQDYGYPGLRSLPLLIGNVHT